ncbi:Drug/metabolite transporter [Corchorus olitorius]|uniref:Drug/metabolite transporter n=1 Tax=Corchorus olitorius TaxID=93759 RepID=A0A1R3H2C1_9ROSI|nr:Drug/metabolite transporter [Corchorus olitorius]
MDGRNMGIIPVMNNEFPRPAIVILIQIGRYRKREKEKGEMMGTRYLYKEVLPCIAMVAVECSNVVLSILFKAASSKGLSYYIFIAYSYGLATIALIPLTFFLIRKAGLPPFKFPLISRLCLLALTGFAGELCGYKGLELGAPTLSSAISNLVPAFTFILAVFFSSVTQPSLIRASQLHNFGQFWIGLRWRCPTFRNCIAIVHLDSYLR